MSEGGKVLLFRFAVDNFVFQFDQDRVDKLSAFLNRSGLANLTVNDVFDGLARYAASTGLIQRSGFGQWLAKLSESLTDNDVRLFESMFDAFDRSDSGVVDIVELVCGLSVLCSGSKSDKLAYAFDSLDDDADGFLTKRGLWRYFRAFLSVLITLSGAFDGMAHNTRMSTLDETSVWTATEILSSFSASSTSNELSGVSFEEIAEWYSLAGHSKATWLELLDLKKWTRYQGQGGSASEAGTQDVYDSKDEGDAQDSSFGLDSEDLGSLHFNIRLGDDEELLIFESDSKKVRSLLLACPVLQESAAEVVKLLEKWRLAGQGYTSSAVITQKALLDCFLEAMHKVDVHAKQEAMTIIMDVFRAFDPRNLGYVPFNEFATGMTILGAGSKSYKLELGFKLSDVDRQGTIPNSTLTKFLKSYLRVLVALSSTTDISDDEIHHVCAQLASSICDRSNEANFSDFSSWYNDGGHTHAAWVELIDLSKWVHLEDDEEDDDEDDSLAGGDARINLRLQTELAGPDNQISISKLTSAYVHRLATVLGLSSIVSEDMFELFVVESTDGLISRDGFDRGVRKLTTTTHQQLSGDEKDEYSTLLHSLFYAYDRTGSSEVVEVSDLCCGFSILCQGSKSEKLGFAFDILDDNDDGYLTKRGLFRFFRSFLASLLTLCGALGDLPAQQANHILDASTRRTCDSIYASLRDADRGVTFNDVANWYKHNCDEFPWLELLDLSKWSQLAVS